MKDIELVIYIILLFLCLRQMGKIWACNDDNDRSVQGAEWLWDRPHHYRCSKCQWMGGISAMSYKFCPACGRKMSVSKAEYDKEFGNAGDWNDS